MPKGFTTAGLVVLFETTPSIEQLTTVLETFDGVRALRDEPADELNWMAGRGGAVVTLRAELNHTAAATILDRRWPDGMGDPKTDPMLFGAWSMGFFGPYAYPGNLERAVQQAWTWDGAAVAAERHRAFVRITATHVGGLAPDAPVLPAGYDPLRELNDVTRVAQAILRLPGALALFAPSGELLLPAERVDQRAGSKTTPIDLWTNVRMIRLADEPGWLLMDTIGMEQLDVNDLEACYPRESSSPNEVAGWLRNVSEYLRAEGPVIKHGDTLEGPDGTWRALEAESLLPRPRPTLRLFPLSATKVPEKLREGIVTTRAGSA